MPIIIPKEIPAYQILKDENIFVMSKRRANTQDIRPIDILIVNFNKAFFCGHKKIPLFIINYNLSLYCNTTARKSKDVFSLFLKNSLCLKKKQSVEATIGDPPQTIIAQQTISLSS